MDDVAARLERSQWDFFWVTGDTRVVDRPEIAYLASTRPHLNRVYRLRAEAAALPALIAEVDEAHVGGSTVMLADTIDLSAIGDALVGAGYQAPIEHVASVIAVDDYQPRECAMRVERVQTKAALLDMMTVFDEAFGDATAPSDDVLAEMLAQCTGDGARTQRFVGYDGARPVTAGALTLYPALGVGTLWGGSTVPDARGRGAYSATVGARVQAARRAGIDCVGLYARGDTSAPIVARLGFGDVGRMWQWQRDP